MTRWFSDASVLSRYGIATVNYGTSTGLLDTVKGENLEIDGLVKTAEVYARAAMKVCGVADEAARRLSPDLRVLGAALLAIDAPASRIDGALAPSPSRTSRSRGRSGGRAGSAALRGLGEAVHRRRASGRRARRRPRGGHRPRVDGQFWRSRIRARSSEASDRRGVPRLPPPGHVQGGHRLPRRCVVALDGDPCTSPTRLLDGSSGATGSSFGRSAG